MNEEERTNQPCAWTETELEAVSGGLDALGLGCPRGHQRDSHFCKKGGSALRAQLQKDQQLLHAALRTR